MKVVAGDATARNFGGTGRLFQLPASKSGLWNSLCVLADGTVVALTSTNAYSSDDSVEVWMIKGKLAD